MWQAPIGIVSEATAAREEERSETEEYPLLYIGRERYTSGGSSHTGDLGTEKVGVWHAEIHGLFLVTGSNAYGRRKDCLRFYAEFD